MGLKILCPILVSFNPSEFSLWYDGHIIMTMMLPILIRINTRAAQRSHSTDC